MYLSQISLIISLRSCFNSKNLNVNCYISQSDLISERRTVNACFESCSTQISICSRCEHPDCVRVYLRPPRVTLSVLMESYWKWDDGRTFAMDFPSVKSTVLWLFPQLFWPSRGPFWHFPRIAWAICECHRRLVWAHTRRRGGTIRSSSLPSFLLPPPALAPLATVFDLWCYRKTPTHPAHRRSIEENRCANQ